MYISQKEIKIIIIIIIIDIPHKYNQLLPTASKYARIRITVTLDKKNLEEKGNLTN